MPRKKRTNSSVVIFDYEERKAQEERERQEAAYAKKVKAEALALWRDRVKQKAYEKAHRRRG